MPGMVSSRPAGAGPRASRTGRGGCARPTGRARAATGGTVRPNLSLRRLSLGPAVPIPDDGRRLAYVFLVPPRVAMKKATTITATRPKTMSSAGSVGDVGSPARAAPGLASPCCGALAGDCGAVSAAVGFSYVSSSLVVAPAFTVPRSARW